MTCNHSYAGGKCIYCGSPQLRFNNGKPSNELSDLSGLKNAPTTQISKKKRATSQFQYNTQLLLDCLGVPVKEFPRYARYVKKLGVENIHKIIKEIESADRWCRETHHQKLNKIGFFINKYIKVNKLK